MDSYVMNVETPDLSNLSLPLQQNLVMLVRK